MRLPKPSAQLLWCDRTEERKKCRDGVEVQNSGSVLVWGHRAGLRD